MRLASLPTILLAVALAGPALWRGYVTGELDQTAAIRRLLIALPVAGVMVALLRWITDMYRTTAAEAKLEEARPAPLRVSAVTGQPLSRRRESDAAGTGTRAAGTNAPPSGTPAS